MPTGAFCFNLKEIVVDNNSFRSKKKRIVDSLEFQFLSVKEVAIILATTSKTVRLQRFRTVPNGDFLPS